jgi:hypothetical protein
VSGQSFLELLRWHPRDVDTLQDIYEDRASDARMVQAREHAHGAVG